MSSKRRTTLKVVLIGDANCGKTSILTRYFKGSFDGSYRATIGCDFFCKLLEMKDRVLQLQVWDTAGQERHRALSQSFYRGSDVALLVYDVNDPKTLANLKIWKDEFLAAVDSMPLLVVLGNKADTETAAQCQYKGDLPHFLVSAKTGLNIQQAFDLLATKCIAMDPPLEQDFDTKIVIRPTVPATQKPTCC